MNPVPGQEPTPATAARLEDKGENRQDRLHRQRPQAELADLLERMHRNLRQRRAPVKPGSAD